MAEDTNNFIDAEFTGQEAANIELRMINGQPLKGGPYVMGNNATARRVRVHPDDWALLEGTRLLKRVEGESDPTQEQQQQDADNSAVVDMLQRAGINQETAAALEAAGYTTPDAIRNAKDEDLKAAGVDNQQLKKLRQNIGTK